MDSQPFTTASPFAQISFSLFARTPETPLGGPGHTQAHGRADYTRPGGRLGDQERHGSAGRGTVHFSTTESARTSSAGGIVRPSALAVLRLIARSNFDGC